MPSRSARRPRSQGDLAGSPATTSAPPPVGPDGVGEVAAPLERDAQQVPAQATVFVQFQRLDRALIGRLGVLGADRVDGALQQQLATASAFSSATRCSAFSSAALEPAWPATSEENPGCAGIADCSAWADVAVGRAWRGIGRKSPDGSPSFSANMANASLRPWPNLRGSLASSCKIQASNRALTRRRLTLSCAWPCRRRLWVIQIARAGSSRAEIGRAEFAAKIVAEARGEIRPQRRCRTGQGPAVACSSCRTRLPSLREKDISRRRGQYAGAAHLLPCDDDVSR